MYQEENLRGWENIRDNSQPSVEEYAMLEEMINDLGISGVVELYTEYRARRLELTKRRIDKLTLLPDERYDAFRAKWDKVPLTGIMRDVMGWLEVLELKPSQISELFGFSLRNISQIRHRALEKLENSIKT